MTQGGNVGKAMAFGLFEAEMAGYVFDLRWMLALLAALIVADFWWGVRVAKAAGDAVRASRAWRRTLNKFVDYMTYVVVGAFLAQAVAVPTGYASSAQAGVFAGLLLGAFCEFDSVVKHVFFVHGVRFSWKRLIVSLIKLKSPDWGQAVDDAIETEER